MNDLLYLLIIIYSNLNKYFINITNHTENMSEVLLSINCYGYGASVYTMKVMKLTEWDELKNLLLKYPNVGTTYLYIKSKS